jgi:hypothetical protein
METQTAVILVFAAVTLLKFLCTLWDFCSSCASDVEKRKVMGALSSADTQHAVDDARMRKALGHTFRIGDMVVMKAGLAAEAKDDDGNVYPLDGVDATVVRVVDDMRFCVDSCPLFDKVFCSLCFWAARYAPMDGVGDNKRLVE